MEVVVLLLLVVVVVVVVVEGAARTVSLCGGKGFELDFYRL